MTGDLQHSLRIISENLERIAASLEKMNRLNEQKLEDSRVGRMRQHNSSMKDKIVRGRPA